MLPANLVALRERANQPPSQHRQLLLAAGRVFGSVSLPLAAQLLTAAEPLVRQVAADGSALELLGNSDSALRALALWLREQGHTGAWHEESLAVNDDAGRPLGRIERGVVRPLGIATHAVHLVGSSADGRIWLQQRARSKATDPGKWDTLMGGMIAADESLETATARETWEEAGLRLESLGGFSALRDHGIVQFRRPVPDSGTDGYLVERIHALSCVIPNALRPKNQDGEVERFELVSTHTLLARIEDETLTMEAALVLAHCFGW